MEMNMTYDGVVVLAGGMYHHPARTSGWKLQLNAHMRVAAASELYHHTNSRKMLVSGGKNHGEDNPALSHIIAEELARNYKVPLEDIILEERSVETTENAEFSARILKEESLDEKVALVTTFYHLPRALEGFRKHGIDADGYASEDILNELSPRHERLVMKIMNEPGMEKTVLMNRFYHAISVMPFGEKILRYAAHKMRQE